MAGRPQTFDLEARPSGRCRVICGACAFALVAAILAYKLSLVGSLVVDPLFAGYGLAVGVYLISRFALSLFYRPYPDQRLEPTIALVMPAFNEEDAVAASIGSMLSVDYPPEKLELVAVDDGSTDATGAVLDRIAGENPRVRVIHFACNRGKRAAMAAGIRATHAEVVAFVDSDSVLAPDALRALVQPFADARVGAVAGHADVLNSRETLLTRIQAIRYLIAFRVYKGAESVFGAVTCCSGCFAGYRRAAIEPQLRAWEEQSFLGVQSTYGDDRSLTNFVLRDWRVLYESRARSATIVPAELPQFLRQQARWKRSWTRESLVLARFLWRKHPAASIATYSAMVLPLVSPAAFVRAALWRPLVGNGALPLVYLGGAVAVGVLYSLYYAAVHGTGERLWLFGIGLVCCQLVFLMWQTYYAILTVRHSGWGTRSTAPPEADARPARRRLEPAPVAEIAAGDA